MPMHDSIKSSFDPDAIKYLQAPMKRPALRSFAASKTQEPAIVERSKTEKTMSVRCNAAENKKITTPDRLSPARSDATRMGT